MTPATTPAPPGRGAYRACGERGSGGAGKDARRVTGFTPMVDGLLPAPWLSETVAPAAAGAISMRIHVCVCVYIYINIYIYIFIDA